MFKYILPFAILFLTAPFARAGDIEIVLDRQAFGIQLYLKAPLDQVPEIFDVAMPPDAAISGVDLAYAATLLETLNVTTPDGPVALTVSAALLHPTTTPIPFHAPWDADSATEFGADIPRPTGDADLYVAFEASHTDAPERLTVSFSNTIPEGITATLRAFSIGQIQRELTVDLAITPEIAIEFTTWSPVFKWIFGLGLAGFVLSGVLLYRAPPLEA